MRGLPCWNMSHMLHWAMYGESPRKAISPTIRTFSMSFIVSMVAWRKLNEPSLGWYRMPFNLCNTWAYSTFGSIRSALSKTAPALGSSTHVQWIWFMATLHSRFVRPTVMTRRLVWERCSLKRSTTSVNTRRFVEGSLWWFLGLPRPASENRPGTLVHGRFKSAFCPNGASSSSTAAYTSNVLLPVCQKTFLQIARVQDGHWILSTPLFWC